MVVLSFYVVLLVVYFRTISVPPQRRLFLWKNKRFQTVAEERFFFSQVYYIQTNFLVFVCVSDFEVEPLVVPFGVYVVLQNEVVSLNAVLFVGFFEDEEEIATLKMGVENERGVADLILLWA